MNLSDLTSTTVFLQRPLGVLHITGATRLDLIDRMSTQKVLELRSGEGAATVFTTEIGRIIDRVLLFAGEKKVIAVTGENYGDPIARYLMSYVFFNDDFQLVDRSSQTAVVAIYGAQAHAVLAGLGLEIPGDLPLHGWIEGDIGGCRVSVHRTDPIGEEGFLLLVAAEEVDQLYQLLNEAEAVEIDAATFDALRIAAGRPRLGFELTRDYIPLEAGLWDDVSFNKGCYIGQEIIARMESRGKLAKRLVAVHGTTPLAAGSEIEAGGKVVGSITSAAGTLGLGYVKTAVLDEDHLFTTGGAALSVIR